MRQEIIDALSKITEEEKEILEEGRNINPSLYNMDKSGIVDAKRLLSENQLISLRTHTRFVHFPKHSHNYVEVVYMVSGSTKHIINDNEVILGTGELLFMNQHAVQEIFPATEKDIAVNLIILPEFFDSMTAKFSHESDMISNFLTDSLRSSAGTVDYLHFKVSDVPTVQNLMENMIWMLLNENQLAPSLYRPTMELVFFHLINCTDRLKMGTDSYESKIMLEVYAAIENNYKNANLTELSEKLKIDIYTLSRIIKKNSGLNFTDLLQTKRLDTAAMLLSSTSLPINDISLDIGYNNFTYFYRLFKNRFDTTPREYRKSNEKPV